MNQSTNNRTKAGFTLIELMLSMTFVAVLLMMIAFSTIQIATIYNRGMTLKEVNQSSRDIADDLRRTFEGSPPFTVNTDGTDSADYIRVQNGASLVGGRLCTGTYSYIWNLGPALHRLPAPEPGVTNTLYAGGAVNAPIRLVKIPDVEKKYCEKTDNAPTHANIVEADVQQMTDLLDHGDSKLTLQAFRVTTTSQANDVSTGQRLYTVNYTLSSGDTSAIDLTANPIRCLGPDNPNSNPTYCNVQQFTIVLRVGDTVN